MRRMLNTSFASVFHHNALPNMSGSPRHVRGNSSAASAMLTQQWQLPLLMPSDNDGPTGMKLYQVVVPDAKLSLLSVQGIDLEECLTSGPGSAAVLASQAAAAMVDVVLAVGGDGTVHEAVSGLVQQQQLQKERKQQGPVTALAVLPLGTGSDYARTFGWRINDAAAACERIASGKVQLTDVSELCPQAGQYQHRTAATATAGQGMQEAAAGGCTVQHCYAVNVASCAVGALSAARAARLKQLGPLCYPVGGALTLLGWKGCGVQVCLDDCAEWQVLNNLTTLALGQGRFWGGGLQILPDADPTDGFMDVVALQGLGLWDFISKGHLLRTGQHMHVKGVNMLGKCRRLQVRPAEEGSLLAWECDGEPQGQFGAVDIRVLPAALRLLSGKPASAVGNWRRHHASVKA